jgi:hypothetical protein
MVQRPAAEGPCAGALRGHEMWAAWWHAWALIPRYVLSHLPQMEALPFRGDSSDPTSSHAVDRILSIDPSLRLRVRVLDAAGRSPRCSSSMARRVTFPWPIAYAIWTRRNQGEPPKVLVSLSCPKARAHPQEDRSIEDRRPADLKSLPPACEIAFPKTRKSERVNCFGSRCPPVRSSTASCALRQRRSNPRRISGPVESWETTSQRRRRGELLRRYYCLRGLSEQGGCQGLRYSGWQTIERFAAETDALRPTGVVGLEAGLEPVNHYPVSINPEFSSAASTKASTIPFLSVPVRSDALA